MKHLLKMSDLTPDEVAHILDVADELKAQQKAGGTEPLLKGRSVALMFSKNSTAMLTVMFSTSSIFLPLYFTSSVSRL